MSRQWLERVEEACVRRRLPGRTVRRLVEELGDHLADARQASHASWGEATSADISVEDRLGLPEELAESARRNLLAGSLPARHPVLTFLVLPIPFTVLGWAVMLAATIGLLQLAERLPAVACYLKQRSLADWPAALLYAAPLLDFCLRVLPPAAAVVLCCRWSERALGGARWRMLACALIALVSGMFFSVIELPMEPGKGRWSVGFMAPGGWDQLLQLLIPPAVALWWTFRRRREAWGDAVSQGTRPLGR
jgi:hypothetical protein